MKARSLFVAFLIITFNASFFAQDTARAAAAWRVLKYDITANVPQNPADRYLAAKAILNLQNVGTGTGSRLTLRINDKAEIASVQVNGATAAFTKGSEAISSSRNLQRIIVTLPSIQPNANFTVGVDYKLKVEENFGLNAISSVGSQFLPLSFWYPTPSSMYSPRGADYAPFRLNVTSSNENVVASGVQNSTSFDQKLNAQPFFVTGSWDAVEGIGEAKGISVLLPKGADNEDRKRAQDFLALTAAAKTFAAGLLGNASDSPIRLVFVRRGGGFSDGGTILLEQGALRRQKMDSQTALTVSEAIAKIWLGNAVALRGEGYGAIREGLARYIATQFIEKQFGKDVADAERLRQSIAYSAISKRDAPLNTASPLDDYYYAETANKGAMVWRLLAASMGQDALFAAIRSKMQGGSLTLADLRTVFPQQKATLDYLFDQVTDMNLLAGLPRIEAGETKVALRNLGGIDVTVNVLAITDKGEKLIAKAAIPAKSFGEAGFKTTSKIVRVEVDPEKIYPQVDYSDDVAPRDFQESDPIVIIKRDFDRQNYLAAEKSARTFLAVVPRYNEARMWLGRILQAQGKNTEAEKVFKEVIDDKLPSPRGLAWASAGLADISLKTNNRDAAFTYFTNAIRSDAEYGATLLSRLGRQKLVASAEIDPAATAFFSQFDRAAVSNRKTEVDALVVPGEITRFAGGIAGQAEQWQTRVLRTEKLDVNNLLVETNLNIKMLSKDAESGMAVFLLSKSGGGWKLSGVEIFEVR